MVGFELNHLFSLSITIDVNSIGKKVRVNLNGALSFKSYLKADLENIEAINLKVNGLFFV